MKSIATGPLSVHLVCTLLKISLPKRVPHITPWMGHPIKIQERKRKQPKEGALGTDILRTSGCYQRAPNRPKFGKFCGPGKLTEKGKFQKVLRGGCKRSFGPREQRSPKSLFHHPKLLLHRRKMGLHRCKRLCAPWVQKTFCTLPEALLGIFPFRSISQARSFPIQNREVLHGAGADGVGVKFPMFAVSCSRFSLVF